MIMFLDLLRNEIRLIFAFDFPINGFHRATEAESDPFLYFYPDL